MIYNVGDHYDCDPKLVVFRVWSGGTHGSITTFDDFGKMNWNDAVSSCNNLTNYCDLSNYYLPTRTELNILMENYSMFGILEDAYYWSSTKNITNEKTWTQLYTGSETLVEFTNTNLRAKPIHTF
jgi:hypothetical protein